MMDHRMSPFCKRHYLLKVRHLATHIVISNVSDHAPSVQMLIQLSQHNSESLTQVKKIKNLLSQSGKFKKDDKKEHPLNFPGL